MSGSISNCFCRLGRDRRGVSAVEFAIVAPMMVILMLGAYDLGNAAQQQIALQEAVRAGGEYAQYFPTNPAGIQTAILNALPSGWVLTNPGGSPVVSCSCTGTNGTETFDCSTPPSDCSTSSPMLVSITATMAYSAIDPVFAAALPNTTATYVVRFR